MAGAVSTVTDEHIAFVIDQSWLDFAHLVLTDQFPTESAVDRWLQALTVRQRLVLFLAVVQELDQPEIGELLGLADSAVRMTMSRIRNRLITIPLEETHGTRVAA